MDQIIDILEYEESITTVEIARRYAKQRASLKPGVIENTTGLTPEEVANLGDFKAVTLYEAVKLINTMKENRQSFIQKLTCQRCGHRWIPRQTDVRMCPKCKSVHWDEPRKESKMKANFVVPSHLVSFYLAHAKDVVYRNIDGVYGDILVESVNPSTHNARLRKAREEYKQAIVDQYGSLDSSLEK